MPYRILLCDDEPHILRAAQIKFQRAGYEVFCASDGEEAWQQIEKECPDILITDYQMPRLNGLALVERIRRCDQTNHLPVIMLTAKGFELSQDEILDKWSVAVLMSKPFSPRELEAAARKILEGDPVTTDGWTT